MLVKKKCKKNQSGNIITTEKLDQWLYMCNPCRDPRDSSST